MANEINGVSGIQQTQFDQTKQTDMTKQDASKVDIKFPKSETPEKPQDFNVYGKDIANFAKFKGNDKNDAMRMTNAAANDVKKAYMQLQHEFPTAALQFEPMPDPTKCGKKREGFFNYQQQLEDWKDRALTQIANAREKSIEEIAGNIMKNDDANTAKTADLIEKTGDKVIDNDNKNAEKTGELVKQTGDKIIANDNNNTKKLKTAINTASDKVVHYTQVEGDKTRNAMKEKEKENKKHEIGKMPSMITPSEPFVPRLIPKKPKKAVKIQPPLITDVPVFNKGILDKITNKPDKKI